MTKKNFCQACHNQEHGVKTRIAVPHTCDKGIREAMREDVQRRGVKVKSSFERTQIEYNGKADQ